MRGSKVGPREHLGRAPVLTPATGMQSSTPAPQLFGILAGQLFVVWGTVPQMPEL